MHVNSLLRVVATLALLQTACGDDKSSDAGKRDASEATQDDAAVEARSDAQIPSATDGSLAEDASLAADANHEDAAIAVADAGLDAGANAAKVPVFVAVGYAGRRVRSVDLGLTWTDDTSLGGGGDDENLLRAVAFGHDVFVAVGWKILTSADGRSGTWTDRTLTGQQWLGGIAFGNNRFVATGGYGSSAYSTDGLGWAVGGALSTEASRSLAFGGNIFISATDAGHWWTSTDGSRWLVQSEKNTGDQVAHCAGSFRQVSQCTGAFTARTQASGNGVVIRVRNGELERSTNAGASFVTVLSEGQPLESVAFGQARR